MASHIRLNRYLGFGRFRYLTGAQVLRKETGPSYLRWAHNIGIVLDCEILFQLGIHPEQVHANKIDLTPELLAEAQAHEDQLNGVNQDEKAINPNQKCPVVCHHRLSTCRVCKPSESESGSGPLWLLYC